MYQSSIKGNWTGILPGVSRLATDVEFLGRFARCPPTSVPCTDIKYSVKSLCVFPIFLEHGGFFFFQPKSVFVDFNRGP